MSDNEEPERASFGYVHRGTLTENDEETQEGNEYPGEETTVMEDAEFARDESSVVTKRTDSTESSTADASSPPTSSSDSKKAPVKDKRGYSTQSSASASISSSKDTDKSNQGLIWHAVIVQDDYNDPKYCFNNGALKPRRPLPMIRKSDFFSRLQMVDDKVVFDGPLNKWPGLTNLEVRSVTGLIKGKFLDKRVKLKRYWDAKNKDGKMPAFPNGVKSVRVSLYGKPWTAQGWSEDSEGFIWWFKGVPTAPAEEVRLLYGINMINEFKEAAPAKVTNIHHFAHRYAKEKAKETARDRVVYHTAILLEWDHELFTTVVELAWFQGCGGYGGKSNWQEDMETPEPQLLKAHPDSMILPWNSSMAEIRCTDVPSKNFKEFQGFMEKYTARDKRFYDVHYVESSPVKLANRSQVDVAGYLCNYIRHNKSYTEDARNCQTFAADFYRLMSGKSSVPFHLVCQLHYKKNIKDFVYELSGARNNDMTIEDEQARLAALQVGE